MPASMCGCFLLQFLEMFEDLGRAEVRGEEGNVLDLAQPDGERVDAAGAGEYDGRRLERMGPDGDHGGPAVAHVREDERPLRRPPVDLDEPGGVDREDRPGSIQEREPVDVAVEVDAADALRLEDLGERLERHRDGELAQSE